MYYGFRLVLDGEPQEVGCAGKAEPGPGGIVPEQGNGQAAVKGPGGYVFPAHVPEDFSCLEHGGDLVIAAVPGQQEIIQVHTRGV